MQNSHKYTSLHFASSFGLYTTVAMVVAMLKYSHQCADFLHLNVNQGVIRLKLFQNTFANDQRC